jgi:hypothetical protein
MSTERASRVFKSKIASNPFIVESPEKLSAKDLKDLFVEKFTQIEVLKERKHIFIWGSRGSGKSIMLRYLEPQCQILVHGGVEEFFEKENFIAIYCPCKEGQINKTDLRLLNEDAASIISEHILVSYIVDQLIDCILMQFPESFFDTKTSLSFAEGIMGLFDRASIVSSVEEINRTIDFHNEPLLWLKEFFAADNRRLTKFLRDSSLSGGYVKYEGATTGYHDFLLPCLRNFQRTSKLNLPLYVMLDDADRLSKIQQRIINTWIANRDQATVCFKVSAQQNEYGTFLTRSGGLIEQPHDYSEIDVDELYTSSKSDYEEKVKLIAERRLGLSDIKTKSIDEVLPVDPEEYKLYTRIRDETAKEWDEKGRPGRQEDYITRYANARLFQYLSAHKMRKSYAGFHNLVHLSSGVIRDFLEPCYIMFDRYVTRVEDPSSILSIPPGFQDDIIFRYSEQLLLDRPDQIKKDLPIEQWSLVDKLATLIESLGRLFYERLHDPEAREARLFSFAVRGNIPTEIEEVLNLGLRYRYFQRRTYSTKEGGGREKWYILHRRLCPVFKLDPTGFEGRISLTPDLLKIACENPARFVRVRLKQAEEIGLDFYLSEEGD